MARLCIRITQNSNTSNPSLDTMRTQIGDVVCVVEDGHVFSRGELGCKQYRFIDILGVPQKELIHLVAPIEDLNGNTTRIRALALNPITLNSGTWKNRTAATKDQIAAITVSK